MHMHHTCTTHYSLHSSYTQSHHTHTHIQQPYCSYMLVVVVLVMMVILLDIIIIIIIVITSTTTIIIAILLFIYPHPQVNVGSVRVVGGGGWWW